MLPERPHNQLLGGTSNVTTHLLDLMHYDGLLRSARRDGVRVYAPDDFVPIAGNNTECASGLDGLPDIAVKNYRRARLRVFPAGLRYAGLGSALVRAVVGVPPRQDR
jgi:hypothetical protein